MSAHSLRTAREHPAGTTCPENDRRALRTNAHRSLYGRRRMLLNCSCRCCPMVLENPAAAPPCVHDLFSLTNLPHPTALVAIHPAAVVYLDSSQRRAHKEPTTADLPPLLSAAHRHPGPLASSRVRLRPQRRRRGKLALQKDEQA